MKSYSSTYLPNMASRNQAWAERGAQEYNGDLRVGANGQDEPQMAAFWVSGLTSGDRLHNDNLTSSINGARMGMTTTLELGKAEAEHVQSMTQLGHA
jgi:hypothetical protein